MAKKVTSFFIWARGEDEERRHSVIQQASAEGRPVPFVPGEGS